MDFTIDFYLDGEDMAQRIFLCLPTSTAFVLSSTSQTILKYVNIIRHVTLHTYYIPSKHERIMVTTVVYYYYIYVADNDIKGNLN